MTEHHAKIEVRGRVAGPPELKTSANGRRYAKLSMVVERTTSNDKTFKTFFPIIAWGPLGERIAEALADGIEVCIFGEMENRRYQASGSTEWKDYWHVVGHGFEIVKTGETGG